MLHDLYTSIINASRIFFVLFELETQLVKVSEVQECSEFSNLRVAVVTTYEDDDHIYLAKNSYIPTFKYG